MVKKCREKEGGVVANREKVPLWGVEAFVGLSKVCLALSVFFNTDVWQKEPCFFCCERCV